VADPTPNPAFLDPQADGAGLEASLVDPVEESWRSAPVAQIPEGFRQKCDVCETSILDRHWACQVTTALAFTRDSFPSKLLCTNQSSCSCPPPLALPTLLQYYCTTLAQYTAPPAPSFVCRTPYTILAISLSCKCQLLPFAGCAKTATKREHGVGRLCFEPYEWVGRVQVLVCNALASKYQQVARARTPAEQTTHTNKERATAQRRLIVEVVVAALARATSTCLKMSPPSRGNQQNRRACIP